jgi:hypothetical protein
MVPPQPSPFQTLQLPDSSFHRALELSETLRYTRDGIVLCVHAVNAGPVPLALDTAAIDLNAPLPAGPRAVVPAEHGVLRWGPPPPPLAPSIVLPPGAVATLAYPIEVHPWGVPSTNGDLVVSPLRGVLHEDRGVAAMMHARTCTCRVRVSLRTPEAATIAFRRFVSFRAQDFWFVATTPLALSRERLHVGAEAVLDVLVHRMCSPAASLVALGVVGAWIVPPDWRVLGRPDDDAAVTRHVPCDAIDAGTSSYRLTLRVVPRVSGKLELPLPALALVDPADGSAYPVVVHSVAVSARVHDAAQP